MSKPVPHDGDLVIRKERRGQGWTFVVTAVAGADLYVLRSRNAAFAAALDTARDARTCVWIKDESAGLTLFKDNRNAAV